MSSQDSDCNKDNRHTWYGPLVPFVPRPMPSPRVHRKKPFLALPPSTTLPAATTHLPPLLTDVVPQILSFCDAPTLSRASCVCRSWSAMANADDLWAELCKETFGVAPSELTPPPDPTRMLYVMSHLRLREVARGWGGGSGVTNVQIISASAYRRFVF